MTGKIFQSAIGNRQSAILVLSICVATALITGCRRGPTLVSMQERHAIDRSLVEYPSGYELQPYARNLTAPTAFTFDSDGSLLIAEGGIDNNEPRIYGFKANGSYFQIYPTGGHIPLSPIKEGVLYGPIGGMVVEQGKIYISHRDAQRRGVITAFDYNGNHTTIVADLPAQGEYGVTDLAVGPNGRLYFGVGSATNSGVVGLDDWQIGWVAKYSKVCDASWVDLKGLGYRFDTPNPRAGLFGGNDIAVTAFFQSFGTSNQTRIRHAPDGKPNAAIYSVSPAGGDLKVEAHGIRMPRGLAFNEFGRLYITNNGMELRGTRPVKDDPDALYRLVPGAWYGWPDFSADLLPIGETQFQPPVSMIIKTGYPDLSFLIDHATSGLIKPDRNTLLQGVFPPLSGAAKMDFVPSSGPFAEFRGSTIVALSGDRAPFATSGQKLLAPVGYEVVRVDVDTHQVKDFVKNTRGLPASKLGKGIEALERPCDIKFGPDGAMYILDMGKMETRNGHESVPQRGGRIFRLIKSPEPATAPIAQPAPKK